MKLGTSLLNHHIPDIHPLQKLQDRVPGEPFAAKPSKDAEMDRILKSMEVNILAVNSIASSK